MNLPYPKFKIVNGRIHATFEIWGTIIYFDCAGDFIGRSFNQRQNKKIKEGIRKVCDFFSLVDDIFSTYKNDSEVSRLRRGEILSSDTSDLFQEVWHLSLIWKDITEGAFDPWSVRDGYDPSGLVKGWAADKGVKILKDFGAKSIQINAAGDLSLAGGFPSPDDPNAPWKIGIRDPENPLKILKVFSIKEGAIATSGTYERGSHIIDPFTNLIAIGALSATVYGPSGTGCDVLATALIVSGKDGVRWFQRKELSDFGCWVIERNERASWSYNHQLT